MLRSVRPTAQIAHSAALPRFFVSPAASAFHTSAKRMQAAAESQTVLTPSSGNYSNTRIESHLRRNKFDKQVCNQIVFLKYNRVSGIRGDRSGDC